MKLIKKYNQLYGTKIKTNIEVLDILSEKFAEKYKRIGDAQKAYDELYLENIDFMQHECFVYSLTNGKSWTIKFNEDITDERKEELLSIYNREACENLATPEDLISNIKNQVMKAMCNCGVDMHTALSMIVDEDLPDIFEDAFIVDGADAEPRIEILNF